MMYYIRRVSDNRAVHVVYTEAEVQQALHSWNAGDGDGYYCKELEMEKRSLKKESAGFLPWLVAGIFVLILVALTSRAWSVEVPQMMCFEVDLGEYLTNAIKARTNIAGGVTLYSIEVDAENNASERKLIPGFLLRRDNHWALLTELNGSACIIAHGNDLIIKEERNASTTPGN